jgi:uncharacterized protein (DUF1330 family)
MSCCIFINKKNKTCGKKSIENNVYCKTHIKKLFLFLDLPELAINNVIELLSKYPKTLLTFSSLNKYIYSLSEEHIYKLYGSITIKHIHERYMNNYNLNIIQRIKLTLEKKCCRCDKLRSRIYYPIPIRLCEDCFKDITITTEDLYNKYNIKWDLIIEHFYKSRQNKTYVLIKEVEQFYNLKLHEVHLNDYKRNVAEELKISTKDLTYNSLFFVREYHPKISIVEAEYYTNISKKILNDYIKLNDIPENHIIVKQNKKYIINKETFDIWNDNIVNIKKNYDDYIFKERYDQILKELQDYCNKIPYFSNMNLHDISDINDFIEKIKNSIKEENELFLIIKETKKHMEKFINNNLVLIDDFEDKIANNIANSILKYPDKSLFFPKYNPKNFIIEYANIVHSCPVFIVDDDFELTWDIIYNIIKIQYYDRICKFCNKQMITKDTRIKHEYNKHLKCKFKEDILLFNNNDAKINFAIFDQPAYITNKLSSIIDKYENLYYEKNNNYIIIKKL